MTRNQYYEMAENFYKYAGKEVQYKSLNLYYDIQKNHGKKDARKYETKTATLVGVGIEGNTYRFIMVRPGWGRISIHYSDIKFPNE